MKLKTSRRKGLATVVSVLIVLAIIVVGTAFGIVGYVYLLKGNTQTQNGQTTTTTVVVVHNSTSVTQTTSSNTPNPNADVQYKAPATFAGAGQSGAQITVPAGSNVSVTVTLSSTAATSGLLTVNVREDIVDAPDSQVATLQHTVSLGVGSNTITIGGFVAKDVTTGGTFAPREYFITVDWNSQNIYNPTDPSSREWVKTVSGPGTQTTAAVSYVSGTFSGAGKTGPQIVVPQWTTVDLKVTVNSNASAEGVLSVNIRKDVVWSSDASYTTLTKTVNLAVGANSFDMGTFVMADNTCGSPGCVREYFYTVSWNSKTIYNPTDPGTRENVQTSGSSTTQTSTTSTPVLHAQVAYVSPGTFTGGGQTGSQITVPVGSQVDLRIVVSSNLSATETLSANIRKDIVWYPDVSYTTLVKTVHLGVGRNTVDMGTFTAIDQTGGFPGQVREYFFTVSANGTMVYNPTDPSSREWVQTSSSSTTTVTTTASTSTGSQPSYTGSINYVFPASFYGAGTSGSQITVPVGTIVSVTITVSVPQPASSLFYDVGGGGTCYATGNLTVDVRGDVVWGSDYNVKTLHVNACLQVGSNTVLMGTFTASVKTGGWPGQTREYFITAYWNGQQIYNPTDPSTREWVQTS